jgi:ATP-dependent Lon protease
MSALDDFSFSVEQFSGTARLFPLPNLVLFPHVMQPLHVFEPRYREMLEDALAGDRLIAMAMLAPGWESDYEGRPPIYPMACLGRVAVSNKLEGGSYNLLLVGLRRVRLVRELPPERSFRRAVVEVCEDRYAPEQAPAIASLQRDLRDAFLAVLPDLPQAQDQLDQLLARDISLGTLTDIIGYMLDIGLDDKERLLEEVDVLRRAEMLLSHMSALAADTSPGSRGRIGFPPDFSVN